MLKANKKTWFEKLFGLYNRNLLKRRFHSLRVKNSSDLLDRREEVPLIIYSNHTSWWDGLVMFEILKPESFDAYVMMEEKQLEKLSFFRMLGAFSVVRENFREALKSADYAVELLASGKRKTLIIFPQGEILPFDKCPLKFYTGFSYIISKSKACTVVPCSIRYEFLQNYKPEIFVRFGQIETISTGPHFDRKKFTRQAEDKMRINLENLKSDILDGTLEDYSNIL